MRNLLLLFLRVGGVVTFLLLEGYSLYLTVQHNQEQKLIFNNSWAIFTADYDRRMSNMARYATLGRVNDSLATVNARLFEELLMYKQLVEDMQVDTLVKANLGAIMPDTVYRLIPAMVVRNSISEHHNYLILNKGLNHGVEANMGVILDNGIVGIVRSVGPRHSLVMSVLHSQSHFSASIKGTDYFGSLRWEEKNFRELLLENVPKHADPSIGDTIVTSGYSLIFPKGIPIGTIKWVDDSDGGSDTYKITVGLFANLAKLNRVFIVNKSTQKEQESILQQVQNE